MGSSDQPEQYEPQDTYAQKKRAALIREQWDDYKTRFHPWEDKLVDLSGNNEILNNATKFAQKSVDDSFYAQKGVIQRNNERFGINPNRIGNNADKRKLGLAKTLATVNAKNQAIDYAISRKNSILTEGLGASAAVNRR